MLGAEHDAADGLGMLAQDSLVTGREIDPMVVWSIIMLLDVVAQKGESSRSSLLDLVINSGCVCLVLGGAEADIQHRGTVRKGPN
jgi:hypothetical protein